MSSVRSRVMTIALSFLVASAAVVATPTAASAELTDDEVATIQSRMDYYADLIVGDAEVASLSWYVDLIYDLEGQTMDLYTTKAWTNNTITQPASGEGISIRNIIKPRSLSSLLAAQRTLSDQLEADGSIEGANTISIGTIADVQGLTVEAGDQELDQAAFSARETSHQDPVVAYEQELTVKVGVPVDIVLSDNNEAPDTASRQNDSSPFYGGLGLTTPNNGYCSGAFGARRTAGSVTSYYMISAWHCGSGTYKDRAGEVIGSTGTVGAGPAKEADVIAIKVKSGASSGTRVFDGAWNNSSNYSKPVSSKGRATKGKRFCSSGANSGVHCALKVTGTNVRVKYPSGQVVFGQVLAEQVKTGIALAQGDSGGPVFGPHAGAWAKVQAIGVISGGTRTMTCPSLAAASTKTKCFKKIYFQPIGSALTIFDLQLNYG